MYSNPVLSLEGYLLDFKHHRGSWTFMFISVNPQTLIPPPPRWRNIAFAASFAENVRQRGSELWEGASSPSRPPIVTISRSLAGDIALLVVSCSCLDFAPSAR